MSGGETDDSDYYSSGNDNDNDSSGNDVKTSESNNDESTPQPEPVGPNSDPEVEKILKRQISDCNCGNSDTLVGHSH